MSTAFTLREYENLISFKKSNSIRSVRFLATSVQEIRDENSLKVWKHNVPLKEIFHHTAISSHPNIVEVYETYHILQDDNYGMLLKSYLHSCDELQSKIGFREFDTLS